METEEETNQRNQSESNYRSFETTANVHFSIGPYGVAGLLIRGFRSRASISKQKRRAFGILIHVLHMCLTQ